MANYLNIPEVVDAENLISYSMNSGDRSFNIVINVGTTANWLFEAAAKGTLIPFAIVVTDGAMFALDDVYVTGAQVGTGGSGDSYMSFTLEAKEVRVA